MQRMPGDRVGIAGKFFSLNGQKWWAKGFSYGPFTPNSAGLHLPERKQLQADLAHIRDLGANLLRVYHTPPRWFLDEALQQDLRVFIDIPWDKHRCFFEDWNAQQEARQRVTQTAQQLADHPGLFAISVVNEFPNDIVRFYGSSRLARFTDELMDCVKQQAPDCLTTFVNFPTTEFLTPSQCDFWCFNVYLHDSRKLAGYLDRLQHIAGNAPLLLAEYGVDSIRHGEAQQAQMLAEHLATAAQQGVAGSIVFSYTDEWFTGGCEIDDWAFGVTRRDRSVKPAANAVSQVWQQTPNIDRASLPSVSVIICAYNGAETLDGCLRSMMELDYPEYEVLLVDDGSTDGTSAIAAQYPLARYIRQANRGLSVARNVGARAARGDVVVYTDCDCVADPHWLLYLVTTMQQSKSAAAGGPNIPPYDDSWVAHCVAASPGGPSHVMLDDQIAEHIPGCNMAFDRQALLGIGGFDPQFQQAGDDVDLCWRLLDAGMQIAYAPGAMVWHHRRSTVRRYLRQQEGYGRSEAMVRFKHPQRYGALGHSRWRGIIYGEGAVGLALLPPRIYHGRFGTALFQTIYRGHQYSVWSYVTALEWHLLALFILSLSMVWLPMAAVAVAMWCLTLATAIRAALQARLPRSAPSWCRPLVALLHIAQPAVRGWNRQTHLLRGHRATLATDQTLEHPVKRANANSWDLYWDNHEGLGREHLLESLVTEAKRLRWPGDFDDNWASYDVKLAGSSWHDLLIRSASEQLGNGRRFTRVRCQTQPTFFARVVLTALLIWALAAAIAGALWLLLVTLLLTAASSYCYLRSRRRCLRAASALVAQAATIAGMSGWNAAANAAKQSPEFDPEMPADVCGQAQEHSPAVH